MDSICVDDIFALIKRSQIDDILSMLNDQYDTIKFKSESDGRILFFDLMLNRNNNGTIDFTSTKRCITNDSDSNAQFSIRLFTLMCIDL